MDEATWTRVDELIAARLLTRDEDFTAALERCKRAGLPEIQVSPAQGKFLQLLVRLLGAKNVLEVGTLGGYSATWMAMALPIDGRLVTLELDPKHAKVARENFAAAGLTETVEVRVGPALESLKELVSELAAPFDLAFVDADKAGYPEYFQLSLKLVRRGGLIVFDNVVREGRVLEQGSADASVRGVQKLYELLEAEPRVSCTALQTVGVKGYDGLALALVVR